MNLKKLIIFFVALLLCFVIFKYTFDSKLDYLALGDDLSKGKTPFGNYGKSFTDFFAQYLQNKNKLKSYNNKFTFENHRTTDLISDMRDNKTVNINNKAVNINQSIVDAEIVTLSIGINDLFYKLNYSNLSKNQINTIHSYIDQIFGDISIVVTNIRKLNDCKIYIIGYYNALKDINEGQEETINKVFSHIQSEFIKLEKTRNVFYVDISEGFDKKSYYLPSKKNPFPSLEGYNYISNKIIEKYEKK